MNRLIVFLAAAMLFISCGSFMDGLASMYGGGYGGGYNPYANFWNNASTSATTVPAALDPVNAANAAATTMNANLQNQMKDYWDNAAKDEQQRQKMAEAYAKDYWEHPEKYQNVPVQSGNGVGSSTGNGTVSGNNTSGSRSSSSSSRKHERCLGSGKCNSCNGTGSIWKGYGLTGKIQCPNCHGSGICSGCNGTGRW